MPYHIIMCLLEIKLRDLITKLLVLDSLVATVDVNVKEHCLKSQYNLYAQILNLGKMSLPLMSF